MENLTTVSLENTDNSNGVVNEIDFENEISNALEEPEKSDESKVVVDKDETTTQKLPNEDNIDEQCPQKFKNEDGSTNIEKVLKSYKELEPLINEKAQWEKEKADLLKAKEQLDIINQQKEDNAKNQGFDSVLDMEQEYELVNLEANEYAKYLQYVENPQEIQQKLSAYLQNPSQELLDDIELEFPSSVIKHVATLKERQRGVFEAQRSERQETQKMSNIEEIISKSVSENKELFNYEPFKNMFVNALYRYGDNFTYDDAKILFNTMNEMKQLFLDEFQKSNSIKSENDKETDKLASITNLNSAPVANQNVNLNGLSEKELAKVIRQYI